MTKKPKISVAEVIREMRNMKRRHGGMRRAHYEMIADLAWAMAWRDNFQLLPVEYMDAAEEFERQREQRMIARFKAEFKEFKRKKQPKLRVIEGGVI